MANSGIETATVASWIIIGTAAIFIILSNVINHAPEINAINVEKYRPVSIFTISVTDIADYDKEVTMPCKYTQVCQTKP